MAYCRTSAGVNLYRTRASSTFNQEALFALDDYLTLRFDDLFAELDVHLHKNGKMYFGPCPIHSSNNPTSFNLYHDGNIRKGNWYCHTKRCQEHFFSNVIGFSRGVLSHKHHGWAAPGDKKISFFSTIHFLCKTFKVDLNELVKQSGDSEKRRFLAQHQFFTKPETPGGTFIPREVVRKHLKIPAQYFLERDFPAEILDRFDVGLCDRPGKPMSGRVVIPIYSADRPNFAVGFTGRATYPQCPQCQYWHPPEECCPQTDLAKRTCAKWRHSDGFSATHHLFNLGRAQPTIEKTGKVIVCEGPVDVLRLTQAGYENAVAVFGNNLHDPQQSAIVRSGAGEVILLFDMDESGRKGVSTAIEKLKRSFRVKTPEYSAKDVGDLTVDQIRGLLGG